MAGISTKTQRDIEEIKAVWADFKHDLRTPWTYIPGIVMAAIVAFFLILPWLSE